MTEKQMRYALKANYGWSDEKFDEHFKGHEGEYTDEDYNKIVQEKHSLANARICASFCSPSHAGMAEDDLIHSYDNNFGEWR